MGETREVGELTGGTSGGEEVGGVGGGGSGVSSGVSGVSLLSISQVLRKGPCPGKNSDSVLGTAVC